MGNPCVQVPGLWSTVSREQAYLRAPVLLSPWLGRPGLSANTVVRGLRGMLSSCPIHMCICLHRCVCLQMDTCMCTHGYVCISAFAYVYIHRDRYGKIPARFLHALLRGGGQVLFKKKRKDCTKIPNILASYIQLPIQHLRNHRF